MGYLSNSLIKTFPSGSVQNTTAPTFSGISGVTANNDGSFSLSWSAATGSAATPIRYRMYVALGSVTAAALFVDANWVGTTKQSVTSGNVFQLGDGSTYYINGSTYTFGVRAVSSENIAETNAVILTSTAIASGNIGGVFQSTESAFATQVTTMTGNNSTMSGYLSTFNGYLSQLNTYVNTNLSGMLTTLSGYLSTFNTYLGQLNTYVNTNLSNQISLLTTQVSNITTQAASIASSASSLSSTASAMASTESLLASDVSQFGTYLGQLNTYLGQLNTLVNTDLNTLVNTNLANSLTTLAADLVTFSNDLTAFATQNGILTTEVTTLAGLISALQVAVGSAAGLGGLEVEITDDQTIEIEIIDEQEIT